MTWRRARARLLRPPVILFLDTLWCPVLCVLPCFLLEFCDHFFGWKLPVDVHDEHVIVAPVEPNLQVQLVFYR